MNNQFLKDKKITQYIEQLEMAYAIEFIYDGDTYSIDATHEKTGDNIYCTDGRGFEVWRFKEGANSGSVIAFSKDATDILNVECFDGKSFIDIMAQIKTT
ncbi:MAG: hypothetical protein MJ154_03320 [Candidatus Saccharibacteria bacterium]|nr:hypothetical protein [Candidatus Saccharibacteria bacterium]